MPEKTFYNKRERQIFYDSQEWTDIKENLFKIRGKKCEECGRKKNIQVHHLTYVRFGGNELEEDLKILCSKCHTDEHGLLIDPKYDKKINLYLKFVDIFNDLLTGILLNQIVFWYSQNKEGLSKLRVFKEDKYWIAKRRNDWFEECRISEYQFDRSIKILKQSGIVETKIFKFNGEPTTHIYLNKEKLNEYLKGENND